MRDRAHLGGGGSLRAAACCAVLVVLSAVLMSCGAPFGGTVMHPKAVLRGKSQPVHLDREGFERIGERAASSVATDQAPDAPQFVGVFVRELDRDPANRDVTYWFYPTDSRSDGPDYPWFAAALGSLVVPTAAADHSVQTVSVVLLDAQTEADLDTEVDYDREQIDSADWPRIRAGARWDAHGGPTWLSFFRSATSYWISPLSWSTTLAYYGKGLSAKRFPRTK